MKRGQGTFEYVLLLGGVLLIVVLAIVVLQSTGQQAFTGAGAKECSARLMNEFKCLQSDLKWNMCGEVNKTIYASCTKQDKPDVSCAALSDITKYNYCGLKPLG